MSPKPPARYCEFHLLHALPASCLNRGEDNEPKTMKLGNTLRAMVSSQSWKRTIRQNIEDHLDEHAVRTRSIPPRLARTLRTAGWPEDLAQFAAMQVARCAGGEGLKTDPQEDHRTLAMTFTPDSVLHDLAALCEQHRTALEEAAASTTPDADSSKNTKKRGKNSPATPAALPDKAVNALLTSRTASINMFGRMLAGVPGGHVDGAIYLPPAFTVHTSNPQPDFFTAVEEWPEPGTSGSAHLQTAFFTAGVFYRYAAVNVTDLTRNLDDPAQAAHLLTLFAEEFITSLPQAKRTSTAPYTLPYLVHYAVRDRRPVSYADAFEQPVAPARTGGYTTPARDTLTRYAAAMTRLTGTRLRIAHGHAGTHDEPLKELGTPHTSYDALIASCAHAATQTPTPDPVTA